MNHDFEVVIEMEGVFMNKKKMDKFLEQIWQPINIMAECL